jgi:hypothetical protein
MQIVVQTDLRGVISGFRVSDEEFRGFFSSVVHEILQFDLCAIGGVEPREVYAIGGAPSGGGLCYGGEFLLRRVV